jgi:glucose-6-phosphate dehydrogenase assembly protein OpcA
MHIQLEKTLDVEVVERELAELWKRTSGAADSADDFAVLRARVANLLVYVAEESRLSEVDGIVAELTAIHPSRVLLMLGERDKADHDIEMSLETFCQTDNGGPQRGRPVGVGERASAKRLCCEEITLKAAGSFVNELPSAALPLVIPDLTTFIWWRAGLASDGDKVFDALLRAGDRLVVDSAEFADSQSELLALTRLFDNKGYAHVGISDLNWARLTSWRALLAGFYDVPAYHSFLDRVDTVRIDFIAPQTTKTKSGQDARAPSTTAIAPQALLIAGWLASRLGWSLVNDQAGATNNESFVFANSKVHDSDVVRNRGTSPTVSDGSNDRAISLELNRVEHAEGKPGRLVQVELQTNTGHAASFAVSRSADNIHLATEARVRRDVHRGRVLPVRNRSAAQLLGREMEILCNDRIYQEALAVAALMI